MRQQKSTNVICSFATSLTLRPKVKSSGPETTREHDFQLFYSKSHLDQLGPTLFILTQVQVYYFMKIETSNFLTLKNVWKKAPQIAFAI